MPTTQQKVIIKSGLFPTLLVILLTAIPVHAAIVTQTDNSTTGNAQNYLNDYGYFYQFLGQISGTITEVTLQYNATTTVAAGNWKTMIYQCSDQLAPTACTNSYLVSSTSTHLSSQGAGSYQITAEFAASDVEPLDPSKYTAILIQFDNDSLPPYFNGRQIKGCSPSCYSGGAASGHPYSPDPGVADFYFIVEGATGFSATQNEGVTSIIAPLSNSVTSNNTPLFSYTYYTTRAHDRAGFILRDLTTNQTINTSAASTTISSTGAHTYTEYFGLTTGHLYNWTPYVYTVDGSLPPLYGRSQSFFVETTANYQSLVTQTATTSNPFATSSIYYGSAYATSTNGKITISTSTILQRCPISFLPQVLAEQMQVKLPFSYICDFNRLIVELANGDGNTEGNIVAAIPNNFNGSTTNMTFLDQTAIQNLEQLSVMQNVLRYTIYFLTALAIVSMALGVF